MFCYMLYQSCTLVYVRKIKQEVNSIAMADKTLTCKDCGKEFVFTEGEQAFYAEKGFTNEPARCPDCRKARKAQRRNFDNK